MGTQVQRVLLEEEGIVFRPRGEYRPGEFGWDGILSTPVQEQERPLMIGAIAGDIIGSIYEWHNIKTTDFPLFSPGSRFTDDSVLTIALADCNPQRGRLHR